MCDVVSYMNSLPGERTRLLALVSGRAWRSIRKDIRKHSADAIVLPMIPRSSNWKWNILWLALIQFFLRPTGIMARGVFAGNLALRTKNLGFSHKVCFDGRGAYAAEWHEYEIIPDEKLIGQVTTLENRAVNDSHHRLAVSSALVNHWRTTYGYDGVDHVVVPCTLHSGRNLELQTDLILERRTALGYSRDDIVLVYAGSTAGWQSFELLDGLLSMLLKNDPRIKVLFLSKMDSNLESLSNKFPERVSVKWLAPEDVHDILSVCDYGILVREDSVTNQVASPTKFAEYLAAGLLVLISPHIGDMSEETVVNGLGITIDEKLEGLKLDPIDVDQKQRQVSYVRSHYTKHAHSAAYVSIKERLSA